MPPNIAACTRQSKQLRVRNDFFGKKLQVCHLCLQSRKSHLRVCLHPPLGPTPPPAAITKDSAMLRVGTTQTCSVSQSTPEHSNWSGCACYSLTKGQSHSFPGVAACVRGGCRQAAHEEGPGKTTAIWSRVRAGETASPNTLIGATSILFQRLGSQRSWRICDPT